MTPLDGDLSAYGNLDVNALVSSGPTRSVKRGSADLAGRLRVSTILKRAGVPANGSPARIAGSTNEVWRLGNYVIRVGTSPGKERLRREVRLCSQLPREALYPDVIASGAEIFGEWIVMRYRQGEVLSRAWLWMDDSQRKSAVFDLAKALRVVHKAPIEGIRNADFHLGDDPGLGKVTHEFSSQQLLNILERLRSSPHIDHGFLKACGDRVRSVEDAFGVDEEFNFVHGDLHFENMLMGEEQLVALLDFEWARLGPSEIDIDILARFCATPALHLSGGYKADPHDYRMVIRWMAEGYPEVFERPRFADRLMLTALAFDIPSLAEEIPTSRPKDLHPQHPLNRLRSLLERGTSADRLGWR